MYAVFVVFSHVLSWHQSIIMTHHIDFSRHGMDKGAAVAFRLSRFSGPYRQRLLDGVKDLNDYCWASRNTTLEEIAAKPKTADAVLSEYVMCRFEDSTGASLSKVKHALLGAQHTFPRLKGRLATTWSNLKTWEEQRIARLRPPLPVAIWVLALGLARGHARTSKKCKEQQIWYVFATLMEVGLLCMLRPGELLTLTHKDLALPGSFVVAKGRAALRITSPKNRRQFGESQFVLVKNCNTIFWMTQMHQPGCSKTLWPSTAREFGRRFKQIMSELGVEACGFTPGSLRPGGATMYYNLNVPISTLRFMGRWTVEKSLEHYIQLAMATQIMNKLDESAVSRLSKLAPLCLSCVFEDRRLLENLGPLPKKGSSPAVIVAWCDAYAELA